MLGVFGTYFSEDASSAAGYSTSRLAIANDITGWCSYTVIGMCFLWYESGAATYGCFLFAMAGYITATLLLPLQAAGAAAIKFAKIITAFDVPAPAVAD